ncbi:hypothetical protein RPIT_00480 [Tessaracoccus flavus]|uniref:Glycosyltransferase 2-like domain-containing protein n=1 Tax=Tessaracoccus flavus TaxID=1610493 RepID=A0A1Q2CBJ8_9ACTN|nr:glycosyltransferase family A protein [Tessaracoccus flavus]AQP43479.1 hypothetical protein RPIT_00480 [Tessaracoccus flavus]
MSDLELSYVIPFKDWGLRRIGLAVESARASLGGIPGEVIVSDYGSEFEGEELDHFRSYLESRGAVYVRTETDGVWSRSRALNAGMAVARGRVLVAADADMVVPPDCLQRTAEIIGADPNLASSTAASTFLPTGGTRRSRTGASTGRRCVASRPCGPGGGWD